MRGMIHNIYNRRVRRRSDSRCCGKNGKVGKSRQDKPFFPLPPVEKNRRRLCKTLGKTRGLSTGGFSGEKTSLFSHVFSTETHRVLHKAVENFCLPFFTRQSLSPSGFLPCFPSPRKRENPQRQKAEKAHEKRKNSRFPQPFPQPVEKHAPFPFFRFAFNARGCPSSAP